MKKKLKQNIGIIKVNEILAWVSTLQSSTKHKENWIKLLNRKKGTENEVPENENK